MTNPDATLPDAGTTADPALQAPCWALVLLWSATEPHRAGEVAFIPTNERRLVGRGDEEIEKFAFFGRQRPGEPAVTEGSRAGILDGPRISRRQFRVRATPTALELVVSGSCVTFVNGVETKEADLQEGDTILLRTQALFLCVRRPRTFGGPSARHTFGGPDKYGIVGEAPATCAMRHELLEAAALDDATLIRGESGTGKELAARLLHKASPRAKGPFVSHNVAALAPSLLASELFGNIANYPNPGTPERLGLFGQADQGTLFFDEVGDLPLEAQAAVLRVLDEGECRALGAKHARRVNVRFVGATNKDDRSFRMDFRRRIHRVVWLPPLRERREDIPLLARHLLRLHAQRVRSFAERFVAIGPEGELEPRVDPHLIDYLVHQPWPGNMRELSEVLQFAISKSAGDTVMMPSSMPESVTEPPAESRDTVPMSGPATGTRGNTQPMPPTKEELEKRLEANGWNGAAVARDLDIHRNVVYDWMKEMGLKRR